MVRILSEDTGICKIRDTFFGKVLDGNQSYKILVVSVESTVKSESELMLVVYHVLIQKVRKGRMLTGIIFCRTEIRVHILIAVVSDKGYVL